ncbi:MAG TPA: PQQ-binding-like beta-propeller repeat protein [Pirellulales bacterium]
MKPRSVIQGLTFAVGAAVSAVVPGLPRADAAEPAKKPAARAPLAVAKTETTRSESTKPALSTDPLNKPIGVGPGDWGQWGGSSLRNNTPEGKNIPAEWDVGSFDPKTGEWQKDKAKNIKWVARLGSQSYGNPVVANGHVYVGSNNGAGYLKRYPDQIDLGVLLCFSEADGKFLWQHSNEKLPTGRVHDWPMQGVCATPLVEGKRLWYVTNRGEVVCLDTEGFHDGVDNGPVQNELGRLLEYVKNEDPTKDKVAPLVKELEGGKIPDSLRADFAKAGLPLPDDAKLAAAKGGGYTITFAGKKGPREAQLRMEGPKLVAYKIIGIEDTDEADVIWRLNMMKQLGTSQHNMASCSVTASGDMLFVNTSNGVDEGHINLPAPSAPSFVCLDKNTGKVIWTDNSPGTNVLHGQWSSPAYAVLGGVPQVLFGGGDGWLYSFDAAGTPDGKSKLLWKFDCNPKESKYVLGGRSDRNHIIGTPVIWNGLVFIGVGEDPEHGEGNGHYYCIDPTQRGDVSPDLAFNRSDLKTPLPPRRNQAVIAAEGDVAQPNPNSAAKWHYSWFDENGDSMPQFEETMHRTCGTGVIKDDLLFIADFSGLFHCLDAKTGKVHWTKDMLAASWASPLIVDGKVYIGDEDGDICVFELSAEQKLLSEINMGSSVYSTPVVANNVLFIANKDHVFAIEKQD